MFTFFITLGKKVVAKKAVNAHTLTAAIALLQTREKEANDMRVKHIRTKSANSVKYRLAMTVATLFLIPTTAFAENTPKENGCVIKQGYDPSIPVNYQNGTEGTDYNPGTKPSVSGGGVVPCYPRDVFENGERRNYGGKTWVKVSDKGNTPIPINDRESALPGGTWVDLNSYPYTYVESGGSGVDLTDINNKNNEQDGRLNNHDQQIANINNKDNEQDGRLDGHDQQIANINAKDKEQDGRLDGHDQQIAKIEDGAVFYNRDGDGKKTGGVTLNDGVSKNGVRVGNVAAAKDGRDAVNLDQLKQSLGGESRTDAEGNYVGPKYTVGGVDYGNVGDALAASNSLAVKYTPDENGKPTNNIVLSGDGTGAPVGITNVAAGVNSRDAINKGQLDGVLGALGGGAKIEQNGSVTAPTYNIGGHNYNDVGSAFAATDGRINEMAASNAAQFNRLDGRITDVRNDARAGIAGASALAAMRYDDRPGKISVASGFGGFKDHQAMSVGVGYTTADSVFRMNAGASYDFQNDGTAWNIGLGWTLN